MRAFVLISCCLAFASARPEPPSGYSYRAPAPVQAVAPAYQAPVQSYQAPVQSYQAPVQNYQAPVNSYQAPIQSYVAPQQSYAAPQQQHFSAQNFAPAQQSHSQPQTIVQKHIYVHVPPPEEEGPAFVPQQQFVQPRKHYKIIFIKAPSAPSYSQQIAAAAQAQNEEKTLIYVLVKKPEDIAHGEAPAAPIQLPVSKPEVYFIKYKTQKDHSAAQVAPAGNNFSSGGPQSFGSSYDAPVNNPQPAYGAPIKKKK